MTQSLSLFQIPRRKSDQLSLGHVLSLELEMRRLVEHNNHMTPWHDIPSRVGKPGRFSKAEGEKYEVRAEWLFGISEENVGLKGKRDLLA